VHRDGLVRTWKESERARSTDKLDNASEWTSQDMEKKRAGGTHKLECISGWTAQDMERKRASGTYALESASRWISQDMERKRASEEHSRARERIGMDLSGHGKEASE
jgi:hypothetical protein